MCVCAYMCVHTFVWLCMKVCVCVYDSDYDVCFQQMCETWIWIFLLAIYFHSLRLGHHSFYILHPSHSDTHSHTHADTHTCTHTQIPYIPFGCFLCFKTSYQLLQFCRKMLQHCSREAPEIFCRLRIFG